MTSKQELLNEIKHLHKQFGYTPSLSDMDKHGKYSQSPYYTNFGSWTNALDKVGMTPKEPGTPSPHPTKISNQELIEDLQTFAETLDHTPRWQDMEKNGPRDPNRYNVRFGSWNAAIEEAGLTPNKSGVRKLSKRVLLADLQRVATELEKKPLEIEYNDNGHFTAPTLRKYFDGIEDARTQAGINTDGTIQPDKDVRGTVDYEPYIQIQEQCKQSFSRQELIDELHRLSEKLDKTPSLSNLRNHGKCSHARFYTEFGDWMSALDAAGFDITERKLSN